MELNKVKENTCISILYVKDFFNKNELYIIKIRENDLAHINEDVSRPFQRNISIKGNSS